MNSDKEIKAKIYFAGMNVEAIFHHSAIADIITRKRLGDNSLYPIKCVPSVHFIDCSKIDYIVFDDGLSTIDSSEVIQCALREYL